MQTKLARDIQQGDWIDLEGDVYATMMSELHYTQKDIEDHDAAVALFQFECATVDEVEHETDTCIVLHTSLISFACPLNHELKIVAEASTTRKETS